MCSYLVFEYRVDLLPEAPSFITRVCGSGFHILRFRFGQARRKRSPQIAQAPGALLWVFCCRAMSAACPSFDGFSADVTIVGSDSIGQGMMPLLMTGFAASINADAELTNASAGETVATLIDDGGFGDEIGAYLVSTTNNSNAFEALLAKEANVGMSARRITVDEARALRADGAGSMVSPNQEHIIAVDSMVVVTHASNPVDQLNKDQLAGIFSGEITNWSEVGGPDRPINVISHEQDSASYDYFMTYLYDEERPAFHPQGISSDDQVLSNVMFHDRNAIGYLGYAFQRCAKPLTLVNECGIATTGCIFRQDRGIHAEPPDVPLQPFGQHECINAAVPRFCRIQSG